MMAQGGKSYRRSQAKLRPEVIRKLVGSGGANARGVLDNG